MIDDVKKKDNFDKSNIKPEQHTGAGCSHLGLFRPHPHPLSREGQPPGKGMKKRERSFDG